MKVDFSSSSVIVIGDVMLDTYYIGKVKRISPEAPVPVINVKTENSVPGGAANVANNLRALKSKVTILSAAGDDENRKKLSSLLTASKIDHIFTKTSRPTTSKIRIIGNHQQIARLDFEETHPLTEDESNELFNTFKKTIGGFGFVIISDYAKGVCTDSLCRAVIQECKKSNTPVLVDPKGTDWEKYRGAMLITPNLHELSDICGYDCKNDTDTIVRAAHELRSRFEIENILVTRSEKGMTLVTADGSQHFATEAREVYDVSGAGDTVVAVLGAALASHHNLSQSVRMSNIAAGISVGKFGTSPVYCEEIASEIHTSNGIKICSLGDLTAVLGAHRINGKTIVFTNGCFDILHRGHIEYLNEAKNLGDILVIGLNTDGSVKRLKGESRPLNKQNDRAIVLSALSAVDYVVLFDEDTPHNLIKEIKPDFLVKGGDYTPEKVVGREFAGKTVIIDFVNGYSTTSTIEKMKTE
jgi:D-beta-D-heptose 7-phosphate kinase / D-beta-D-heptose 1-phosphate adenosyltransferase